MSKVLKLLILAVIVFMLTSLFNSVMANQITETNQTSESNNAIASQSSSEIVSNDTTANTQTTEPSVSVTSNGVVQDAGLSLSNILNIFLIVLGVLLFILGIAIITQIKK